MPNIAKVLKEEISRISRKEAKAVAGLLHKPSARARRDIAELKCRMAAAEKLNKVLLGRLAKIEAMLPTPAPAESEAKGWISGKGVRSLRKRLGLTQGEFAKLVGVTSNAVCQWEAKQGTLNLRKAIKAAVFAVRGIGAKEAKQRLAAIAPAKPVKKGPAKPTRHGKAKRTRPSRS